MIGQIKTHRLLVNKVTAAIILLLAFVGAIISLWHGGNLPPKAGKVVKSIIWAVPFGILAGFSVSWWLAPVAVGLCAAGKSTGHGQYFSFDFAPAQIHKSERLDFLISWIRPYVSFYWYCFIGLALVGLAAASGAVICLAYTNPFAALIVAMGGCFKSVAYAYGWVLYEHNDSPEPTQIGEALTGAFAYGACAAAFFI